MRERHPCLLLLLLFSLPRSRAQCTAAIPQTTSASNFYGVFPTSGSQTFCTNVLPAQYVNYALQLSRHQSSPGYRLTLTATAWSTQAGSDFGVAYMATAGTAVSTAALCALTGGTTLFAKYAGLTIPTPGSWSSNYGAQIGLCFHSDGSAVNNGISYSISTSACPAGSYCPANAAAPIACTAVRLHALRVVALLLRAQQRAPPHSTLTILPRTLVPLRRARTARMARHPAQAARRCVCMPCAWSPFCSPRSSLPRPLPPLTILPRTSAPLRRARTARVARHHVLTRRPLAPRGHTQPHLPHA